MLPCSPVQPLLHQYPSAHALCSSLQCSGLAWTLPHRSTTSSHVAARALCASAPQASLLLCTSFLCLFPFCSHTCFCELIEVLAAASPADASYLPSTVSLAAGIWLTSFVYGLPALFHSLQANVALLVTEGAVMGACMCICILLGILFSQIHKFLLTPFVAVCAAGSDRYSAGGHHG